jgi:predicted Rossmann fold nucleotide-binding protein DprA/Smf involved in DNA uptake
LPAYPARLANIPDPPLISTLRGSGIVSGLACGVDIAAHIAVLEIGTIAVMVGGVHVVSPPRKRRHSSRD